MITMTEESNNQQIEIVDEIKLTESKPHKFELIWFFIFTLIWSTAFFIPSVLNTQGIITLPGWATSVLSAVALFGPTIIALILTRINDGNRGVIDLLKKGIKTDFKKKWLLPTFLLTPILGGISFVIAILAFGYTLPDNYYNGGFLVGAVFLSFFIGGPLAEEYGWRGYALEKLQKKFNALTSSLILGAIWSIWNLPLHLISTTTQYYITIWEFFELNTTQRILYTWL